MGNDPKKNYKLQFVSRVSDYESRQKQPEVIKEIKDLDIKKGSLSSNIPTKTIKEFGYLFASFITQNFELWLNKGEFPEILEIAEVTPICQKANLFEKDCRPISILPNISKVYERIMHKQGMDFFINKLSKYHCGFRKGFGTHHCPLLMVRKLWKIRDNIGVLAAVY